MNWFSHLLSTRKNPKSNRLSSRQNQPALEALEDRVVPSSTGLISSNFNGTAIAPNSTVWFTSVVKVSGVGPSGATVHMDHSVVDYTVKGVTKEVAVPDATLTFDPTATTATTKFDAGSNSWTTTVPLGVGGNAFLDAFGLNLPGGLPGGANPVTWKGTFETDTAGVSVNWQFGAAVYTQFSTDYNALNVKPVDSNNLSAYKNSDHAGTPEAFKSFVTGGARGGGGSNWTGSYSATVSIQPTVGLPTNNPPPSSSAALAPSSLAGSVIDESTGLGMSGVLVTLSGTNSLNQTVSISVYTDSDGNFSFSGLDAGNYTMTETVPAGYFNDVTQNQIGGNGTAPDGTTSYAVFSSVVLGTGANDTGYVFMNEPPLT
jgi:hypothetical protein